MARALILTGGIYHPFETSTPALARELDKAGCDADATGDIEAGLLRLREDKTELLVVFCLRFKMELETYAPLRAQWAFSPSTAARTAIDAHLAGGRGLLVMHTGLISFDDWPGWGDIIGARWIWGRSGHPPFGPVAARMTAVTHPITLGLPSFEVDDEVYGDLDFAAGITPLMTAEAVDGGGGPRPALWTRRHGRGRVVVSTLGHDAASLSEPTHSRLIRRAALYALGRDDREVQAA